MKLICNLRTRVKTTTQVSRKQREKNFRQINPLFKNPALPAVITSLLLLCGYIIAVMMDNQSPLPPTNLLLIVMSAITMYILFNRSARRIPQMSERAASCIRLLSLLCIMAEFIHFGVPLFGSVPYNEFGWPVVHHVAVMGWVLVLFGERYRKYDFVTALVIAVMLFNRQLALFALLAYLMTSRYSFWRLGGYLLVALLSVILLGVMRNLVLGVDTAGNGMEEMYGGENLFFIFLYLMGPMYSTNSLDSSLWDNYLSLYWNTIPEWALLSQATGMYSWISFILFYGFFCSLVFFFRYSKHPKLQVFGFLIYSYIYFSFFSNVLVSTPVIANFSIILFFMLLLPKKEFS